MTDDLPERMKRLARIARRALETNKCMSIWCADPDTLDAAAQALTEAKAEIERLREWKQNQLVHWPTEIERRNRELAAAESELSTLRARVREVVGPFADQAGKYDPDEGDGHEHAWCRLDLTIGHLRAARQLMEEVK